MVLEPSSGGRLCIADVGAGFVAYDEVWRGGARGQPVENQPDYAFGMWVREVFEDVFQRWLPRLDAIDAIVRRPRIGDNVRVCYRRLILPCWRVKSGTPLLLSASVVDDSIDLRGASATIATIVTHRALSTKAS